MRVEPRTAKEGLVLIDRQRLLAELQRVFDAPTATTMLGVLDQVAAQVHAAGVNREDFRELKQIVAELAAAQKRTVLSLEELAAAQERTEQRLEGLAAAQERTEERLTRLENVVAELAAAQKRTEERLEELAAAQERTEQRLEELAAAQKRTEERLTRLENVVAELAAAQKRTEQRLEELAAAQKRTEQRLEELAAAQKRTEERLVRLEDVMAELVEAQKRTEDQMREVRKEQQRLWDKFARADGRALEGIYRDKATAYFSPLVRRARLVPQPEVWDRLDGKLTEPLLYDLLLADLIVHGQARPPVPAGEVWLVAEVSVTIDQDDVKRVLRRVSLLRQIGLAAIAAVAGDKLAEGAESEARAAGVAVLHDGQIQFKDEALAAAAGKEL